MKTIGLIGGVSWFSTAEYFVRLNKYVHEIRGGQNSAKILLYNFNFEDILSSQISNAHEREEELLVAAAQKLKQAGADFILICSNTTHKTAKSVAKLVSIPFLDLIELTSQHLKEKGFHKVGLLGTVSVTQGTFYKDVLQKNGIAAVVPNETDCKLVNRIIYDELCHGVVQSQSKKSVLKIIDKLHAQGVNAVILGCTELPILIQQTDTSVTLVDSVEIHVRKAIEMAIGHSQSDS